MGKFLSQPSIGKYSLTQADQHCFFKIYWYLEHKHIEMYNKLVEKLYVAMSICRILDNGNQTFNFNSQTLVNTYWLI